MTAIHGNKVISDFKFADNEATRKVQAMIAAASNDGDAAANWSSNFSSVSTVIDNLWS